MARAARLGQIRRLALESGHFASNGFGQMRGNRVAHRLMQFGICG